jgi:hypothetical protein
MAENLQHTIHAWPRTNGRRMYAPHGLSALPVSLELTQNRSKRVLEVVQQPPLLLKSTILIHFANILAGSKSHVKSIDEAFSFVHW